MLSPAKFENKNEQPRLPPILPPSPSSQPPPLLLLPLPPTLTGKSVFEVLKRLRADERALR